VNRGGPERALNDQELAAKFEDHAKRVCRSNLMGANLNRSSLFGCRTFAKRQAGDQTTYENSLTTPNINPAQ
jgi:hypothetical protein